VTGAGSSQPDQATPPAPARRLKVFISAYACEPEKGSEPGIGWNVALLLSDDHDVHVLTRSNNRGPIEAAVPPGSKPSLTFHYYDLPPWASFWKRKRRGYRLYYYLWQYGAFLKFRNFVDEGGFDIVHHLTFANFAMPAPFVLMRPTSVWGPVRDLPTPDAVFRSMPLRVRAKERLRQVSMWLLTHVEPGRVLTERRADWILETPAPDGQSCFPPKRRHKIIEHPQTGINTSEPEYELPPRETCNGKVRLIICSEFVHWKGATFAAEVFSRIASRRDDVRLTLCGAGREEAEMRRIFDRRSVADRVDFRGYISKRDLLLTLNDSDILLYPSYHHGLATVILQAMYVGLPIVVLAGDAVASTVDGECGLAASGASLEEILRDLERQTERLIDDPDLRAKLGARGQELIATRYEWRQLTKRLSEVYQAIVRQGASDVARSVS
jgi:glycosyltransferase involved in cell wall biosynthesis